MAEIVIGRWVWNPTGREEKVLEVVLTDDDPRPRTDREPRSTTLTRLFSRGDLSVPVSVLDFMVTTGRGVDRVIEQSARTDGRHFDVSLSAANIAVTFPQTKEDAETRTWHLVNGSARGAAKPVRGTLFTDYLATATATAPVAAEDVR